MSKRRTQRRSSALSTAPYIASAMDQQQCGFTGRYFSVPNLSLNATLFYQWPVYVREYQVKVPADLIAKSDYKPSIDAPRSSSALEHR